MEQGSPERSPSASSETRHFHANNDPHADELSLLVNSVPRGNPVENGLRITETSENRDLSAFLQSRQVQPPFSRAPLFGELLAPFQGANGNLAAVPMRGNSHSHDHTLLQATQMSNNTNLSTPIDRLALAQNGSYNNEVMNRYNLPLLNLPPDFRLLTAASRFQGQHIGPSQVNSVPFGNSLVNSSSDANIQQANSALQARANAMMHGASVPLRPMGIQGISNPRIVTNGINMASGSSNYTQGRPSVSGVKRRMVWQDDPRALGYRNWISFVRGDPRYASSLSDNAPDQRYTLYDQRYEIIGQPVDPHLRIFNAINGNGDGGST